MFVPGTLEAGRASGFMQSLLVCHLRPLFWVISSSISITQWEETVITQNDFQRTSTYQRGFLLTLRTFPFKQLESHWLTLSLRLISEQSYGQGNCPRDSPGKNTGMDCHFLLQGQAFDTGLLNYGGGAQ